MWKSYSLSLLLLVVAHSYAQPSLQWQKTLGGFGAEFVGSVTPSTDGGYVVIGSTHSNDGDVSGNHGSVDWWIVKLNAVGGLQWQKALGGSGGEGSFPDIFATADGGYVITGMVSSNDGDVSGNHGGGDCWVVKLDADGNIQWQKCYGGSGLDVGSRIRSTLDGGYIVAGGTNSSDGDVIGQHGGNDAWILKLDVNGDLQWQKCYGGSNSDLASSVQQTSDGGFVFAGSTGSSDGDVSELSGTSDCWVVKLNAAGEIEWEESLGGSYHESGDVVHQIDDGYIVAGLTGSNDGDVSGFHGTPGISGNDYWIVRLNNGGVMQWSKCLGGSGNDNCKSLEPTFDGGFILCGESTSNDGDVSGNHGQDDCWVVKLSGSGAIEWQKSYGGSGQESLQSAIRQTADGGYIFATLTNSNNGDVSGLHGPPLTGASDYWVVKLTHCNSTPVVTNLVATPDSPIPSPCGGTVTLTATGGVSPYLFFWNDGATDENRTGLCAGWYSVTVIDANGCAGIDSAFVDGVVNVSEIVPSGIMLFPNPMTDRLQIISSNAVIGDTRIFNALGELIDETTSTHKFAEVNTTHLPSGIYFIRIDNRLYKVCKM